LRHAILDEPFPGCRRSGIGRGPTVGVDAQAICIKKSG
jgi:hypothetical protein